MMEQTIVLQRHRLRLAGHDGVRKSNKNMIWRLTRYVRHMRVFYQGLQQRL